MSCNGVFSIDMNTFAGGAWSVNDCQGVPTSTPPYQPAGFLSKPGQDVRAEPR
jgi:hypothetical protein